MGNLVETCNSATHLIAGNEEWLETKKHWINSWEKVKKSSSAKSQDTLWKARNISDLLLKMMVLFSQWEIHFFFGVVTFILQEILVWAVQKPGTFRRDCQAPFHNSYNAQNKMFHHVLSCSITFHRFIYIIHKHLLQFHGCYGNDMQCGCIQRSVLRVTLMHRSSPISNVCNTM